MMVKYMNTLVTDRAVLSPCCSDGNVAQMAPTILYHMAVLALVKLWHRFLGVEG